MKKNALILMVLCLLGTSLHAQKQAALTNKFILKTDLAHCFITAAFNAELETRISNKLSLTLGFLDGSRKYKQSYSGRQFKNWGASSASVPVVLPTKGIINSRVITLQLRHYKGQVIPAPLGGYSFVLLGVGKADFEGDFTPYLFDESLIIGNGNSADLIKQSPLIRYTSLNRTLIKAAVGKGFQTMLMRHVTLDGSLGLEYNYFPVSDKTDKIILSGLARHYGPTFFNLNWISGSASLGVSLFVKLGYLIY